MDVSGRSCWWMSILNQLYEDLKLMFLTETKCKIRFIYVGVNCKRKKVGWKNGKNHLKFPFWLFDTLPLDISWHIFLILLLSVKVVTVVFYALCDSRKPERAMSGCQGQLPLREQQAKVSNFVKLIKIVSYKLFHFC